MALRLRLSRTAVKGTRTLLLLVMTSLPLPVAAVAQEPRAGVVAALQGTATVVHTAAAAAAPLKFKDDVFVRDRITTGEKSIVRVLLGGKATVTAREYTVLTITEVPGTATLSVASGRIAVAVSKDRMKPGDVVQITTPNVVAGIRGTVVVAEVAGDRSAITVLRGLIDVTRIDPATGHAVGQPVLVGLRQQIRVNGVTPESLPQPTTITPEKARSLTADFTVIPKNAPAASVAPVTRDAVARAAQDLAAVLPRGGGSGSAQGSGSVNAGGNGNGNGGAGGGAVAVNPGGGNLGTSPGNGGGAPVVSAPALGGGAAPVIVAPGNSGGNPGLGLGNPGKGGNAPAVSVPVLGASPAAIIAAPGNSGGNLGLGLGNPGKSGAAPGNSGGKGKP